MKLRYSNFANRIDIDLLESELGIDIIDHPSPNEDRAYCPLPWGLHSNGDTTGKFSINRDKRVYNCWVCFTGETLVRTKKGFKEIKNITLKDQVLTSSGKFERILEVHQNYYEGRIISIQTPSTSRPVRTTPNHPFLSISAIHRFNKTICTPACDACPLFLKTHKLDWADADSLGKGSWLALGSSIQYRDKNKIKIPQKYLTGKVGPIPNGSTEFELTDDFLWMIGMYLAEGSSGNQRYIEFSHHSKEVKYSNRIRKVFSEYGFTSSVVHKVDKPNSMWTRIFSSRLAPWFKEWLGHGCASKQIPSELFNLPEHKLACIIRGIADGDGHEARDEVGTTSRILALQIQAAGLGRRGYFPTISCYEQMGKLPAYTVYNALNTGRLQKAQTDRCHAIRTDKRRYGQNKWLFDDRNLTQITKEPYDEYFSGYVYNLAVENNPSYTVENLLVHNCGGGSLLDLTMAIKDLEISEATKFLYDLANHEETDEEFLDELDILLSDPIEQQPTMPYFNHNVLNNFGLTDGPMASSFLNDRGISVEMSNKFKLRYQHDATRTCKDEVYVGPAIYFPHFWKGQLVGWQQRWLEKDRPRYVPKYTMTRDFPKNETLYAFDEIKTKNIHTIIVVESVPSALFLWSRNCPAVATFGSNVNEKQLKLLRSLSSNIILAPDNDSAGEKWECILRTYLERYTKVYTLPVLDGVGSDIGDLADNPNILVDYLGLAMDSWEMI